LFNEFSFKIVNLTSSNDSGDEIEARIRAKMASINTIYSTDDGIKGENNHVYDTQKEHEFIARMLDEFLSCHNYQEWDVC
jgi:hypothetical protein